MKTEKLLNTLMTYQKFAQNDKLANTIDGARNRESLPMGELAGVTGGAAVNDIYLAAQNYMLQLINHLPDTLKQELMIQMIKVINAGVMANKTLEQIKSEIKQLYDNVTKMFLK